MPTELPRPPWRVLAYDNNDPCGCWWTRCGDMRCNSFGRYKNEWGVEAAADELTVIEHPQNDQEAVREIIAQTKAAVLQNKLAESEDG